jgi:hypothetical protein
MTTVNPITEARDHYFTLKVFVPSKVTCTEDRLRWYFDHAIRGYYKQFALETDPIRGMLGCSVVVEKTPLKAESQAAEIERLTVALAKANAGFEEYERKWYLACDERDSLAAQVAGLAAERDALKAAKWDVKHTDTMNEMVAMGLARDTAEQKLSASQALLEECRVALKPFAKEAREWLSTTPNATPVMTLGPSDSDPTVSEFTLGDLRAAASLIEKLEKGAIVEINEEAIRLGLTD